MQKKKPLYESRIKLFLFAEQCPSKIFSYPRSGSSKMSNSHYNEQFKKHEFVKITTLGFLRLHFTHYR
jgi:hypothetical protein